MLCVIPSRLAVGETFTMKVKLLGDISEIPCSGQYCTRKPGLRGPFNLNVERQIRYMDNCLPAWEGQLRVDGGNASIAPQNIVFDGKAQGVFPGDTRPIVQVSGLKWTRPGFRFLRLVDPRSGLEAWSNPTWVTKEAPRDRIYWGDPHWQTFFSDGIRCPEELYAFARDEGFLDFGAISDHMEAVTDRQWDYFQAVTNDYNEPGRFVTLIGQEWTNHNPDVGAPGHRNIYYRGNGGPALRSNDPDCNTLAKLWRKLDSLTGIDAIAIPHHSANVVMGVDWAQGWNLKYEKAVEMHSVWGSSERHADDGNPLPIDSGTLGGEMRGRHVVDALKRGYRLGFVGGGDIHDGRPGDELHNESYPPHQFRFHKEGFTAVRAPTLTRENVFDAIVEHRTFAATKSRIYLDVTPQGDTRQTGVHIRSASEEGIRDAVLVRNGDDVATVCPDFDLRIIETIIGCTPLARDEFIYVRITTRTGNLAWSSPVWGTE